MKKFAILRTAKLKSFGSIGGSGDHVMRSRPTPNADPSRRGQNRILRGSEFLLDDVKARLSDLSKPPRKNAVLAVETILTASPEFFTGKSQDEVLRWANASLESMDEIWGVGNLVHASLHMDESTPHLHVYTTPIIDGKLNCRAFLGGRKLMSEMQDRYAENMKQFGLSRGVAGSKAKHTTMKRLAAEANTTEKLLSQTQVVKIVKDKQIKSVRLPTPKAVAAVKTVAAKAPQAIRRADEMKKTAVALGDEVTRLQRAENVSILREVNLFDVSEKLGYTRDKKDREKWNTTVGTVNVSKDGKKFFNHSAGVGGGGAIDFVMHCEDVDFRDAVKILSNNMGIQDSLSAATQYIVKDFRDDLAKITPVKPKKSNEIKHEREMTSWLTEKRKIPFHILKNWMNSGLLYATKFYKSWQAVFAHSENAFLRINPNTGFKGFVSGSKWDQPLILNNTNGLDKKIYVVEGHIDAMSLQALYDKKVAVAGSTGTVKKTIEFLKNNGFSEDDIVLAIDNDKAGNTLADSMQKEFPALGRVSPTRKDWNEDLIAISSQDTKNALQRDTAPNFDMK